MTSSTCQVSMRIILVAVILACCIADSRENALAFDWISDALNRTEQALRGKEDDLRKATQAFDDAKRQVEAATGVETVKRAAFSTLETAVNGANTAVSAADNARAQVSAAIAGAAARAMEATNSATAAATKLQDVQSEILNKKMLACDYTIPVAFDFNPVSHGFFFEADLGFGIKIGSEEIKQLLNGQFQMPAIDPIAAATVAVGIRETTVGKYEEYRQNAEKAFGPGNVYVASQRFVEFFATEQVVKDVAVMYVTGGSGAKDVAQRYLHMLELEYEDLVVWLKNQALGDPTGAAFEVIEAVLTQKKSPIKGVEFDLASVDFVRTYESPGVSEVPKAILDKIGIKQADLQPSITLPHLAFRVGIRHAGAAKSAMSRGVEELVGKDSGRVRIESFVDVVAKHGGPVMRKMVQLAGISQHGTETVQAAVFESLLQTFHFDDATKAHIRHSDKSRIDLTDSPIASRLQVLLTSIAFGNERSVKVTSLTVDLTSGSINVKVQVRNRHSWGTVAEALKKIQDKMKDSGLPYQSLLSDSAMAPLQAAEKVKREAEEASRMANDALKVVQDRLSAADAEINKLKTTAQDLAAQLTRARQEVDSATSATQTAQNAMNGAKAGRDAAQNAVDELKKELDRLGKLPRPPEVPTVPPRIRVKRPF